MTLDEITVLIGQIGFPIAVAAFMLIRTDKRLEALTQTMTELNLTLQEFIEQSRAAGK